MNGSGQKDEGKKKVNEVKTFTVPLAEVEIKTNISINTNSPSKPSKEQIINQAFKFHSQGNISEATKYYQYLINQGLKDHRVFSNYAAILQGHGKLEEAEFSFRKAIELKPGFAETHYNLGIILKDIGKLEEAEFSFRKAIELKPDFAEAHSNLGNILRDIGKLEEAFNSYLKAIDINPTISNFYVSITRFLKESDISQLNKSKLKDILNLLLERNDVSHKELFRTFNLLYSNKIINTLEKVDSDFSKIELLINDKVIMNALKKVTFKDIRIEKVLTKVRRTICNRIAKNIETINYSELQFIIALGEQCFLNEYVYSLTKEESLSINKIIDRCKDIELNETNISILSCYLPLYKLLDHIPSLKSFDSPNQMFTELIELQISEPLKEIELSKNIKKLGAINDNVSQKVKSQYEENPYPRWRYSSHQTNKKISIIKAINNDINPNYIRKSKDNNQLKVLIAGCGTGQHILNTQRYKNAKITGIDLSVSSLAYAQRKINELGISNVDLIQMDILEVGLLKERFDIIESSGVLHHMNDPSKGLKALLGVLKTNGFLKLGLYSELARQIIIEARNYIDSKKLQANEDNIRYFRQKIISGELSNLNSLKNRGDFYSLSECRDLCFHAQEQRFTIKKLQRTLQSNKLEFLGFFLPKLVKSLYKQYFPEDKKQTNLQNWAKFEEKHPTTFAGMYQFWVSKTEN